MCTLHEDLETAMASKMLYHISIICTEFSCAGVIDIFVPNLLVSAIIMFSCDSLSSATPTYRSLSNLGNKKDNIQELWQKWMMLHSSSCLDFKMMWWSMIKHLSHMKKIIPKKCNVSCIHNPSHIVCFIATYNSSEKAVNGFRCNPLSSIVLPFNAAVSKDLKFHNYSSQQCCI